jgi:hypothetical protein
MIRDYYTRCALETIGPITFRTNDVANRIPVKSISTFTTLEELIGNMLARLEFVQIIVCHGNDEDGLLLPFSRGARVDPGSGRVPNASGRIMADLGEIAKQGRLVAVDDPIFKGRIQSIADAMRVTKEDVVRVAEMLGRFQRRPCIVEIRGCNIGHPALVTDLLPIYRAAFGHMTSAPTCRMFYQRFTPRQPPLQARNRARRSTLEELRDAATQGHRTRRRLFPAKGTPEPILIEIRDIDGHAHVDNASFMNDPQNAIHWASAFLTNWQMAAGNSFVVPIMWDDNETTFHFPKEPGFCGKLRMIP